MISDAGPAPKVSVLMLAYNHERYIRQAIESALAQRTSFPFEIVIGEDCSTDGTRAIVAEYGRRHPDRIRLLLRPHNFGMQRNSWETYSACRGQYYAPLEGDDYWTDPDKLQFQVDFLDAHPECVACFHDMTTVDSEGRPLGEKFPNPPPAKDRLDFHDLLAVNSPPTLTVMARRLTFSERPRFMDDLPMGDWPFNLLLARHGTFAYLPRKVAEYRVHHGGAWSRRSPLIRSTGIDRFYTAILGEFRDIAAPAIRAYRKRNLVDAINDALAEQKLTLARRMVWRYLFSRPAPLRIPPHRKDYLLLALSPALWRRFAGPRRPDLAGATG